MRPRDPRRWRRRSRALRLLPGARRELGPAGVTSRQRGELAGGVERLWTPEELGRAYWEHVRRLLVGLVGVVERPGVLELVVLRAPLVLMRLGPPALEDEPERAAVTYPIRSGLLVAPDRRDRGHLRLSAERTSTGTVVLCSEVAGYHPSLAGWGRAAGRTSWLYARTQLRVHELVSTGYMRALAAERGRAVRRGA